MLDKKYILIIVVIVLIIVALMYNMTQKTSTSTTPATSVTSTSTRGIYTAPPTLKGVTPYVPSGMKFLTNGDTLNNDLNEIDNITLDQAVAQMPSEAVGFVFIITDNSLNNVKSVGHAFYKKSVDFVPSTIIDTYRRVSGKQTYEKIANFDTIGNDIGSGDGTIQDAMKACSSTSLCDGFTKLINGTRFGLKSNVTPYSYQNWTSFLYVKSAYTPPTHTWTAVV